MTAFPVELDTASGCELWRGKMGRDGYPIVWRGKRPSAAHRVVYEAEVGPIAEGLVLDHLCRNPLCCAPQHLEPVTQTENEHRKKWRYRAARKTCAKGHDLSLHAVVTAGGGRVCRTCNRERGETRWPAKRT